MKIKLLLLLVLWAGVVWGQKIRKSITAAYIAPKSFKNDIQLSSGVFVFDATKRMGVSNIYKKSDGTYVFKFLGEEQPDAAYETTKDFLTKAVADIDGQKFTAEVVSKVGNVIEKLTEKSQAHIFLRSSLYRVNEAIFNADIKEETYKQLFSEIIKTAKEIQLKELEKSNGQITTN